MGSVAPCNCYSQGTNVTFVRYVVIQLLAYGIDMGLFLMVLKSELFGPIMANVLAKIAAGIFAFIVHRNFTFRVRISSEISKQAVRYFLLLALNIPIASAVLALLFVWISAPIVAKFLSDIICVALTYGLSKYFIFTEKQITPEKSNCIGTDV